jgi:S-adenosylmethionine:tRNA ribosyltransferase-isomerase
MENLKRADFYYDLPEELIAQHPAVPRDTSRMMVIRDGETTHSNFYSIAEFLREGDLLVLNNSKVFPARLYGRKRGTEVDAEFLLLKQSEQYIPSDSNLPEPPQLHRNFTSTWEVMVRPGRRLKAGSAVDFPKGLSAEIKEVTDGGNRIVQFILPAMKSSANFFELLEEIGEMPLPPYITEKLQDKKSYNTIYSTMTGSAAAPTAGLHFTERIFSSLA